MRHLIVISDLHLWQATDSDELWMRYRHRRFLPDAQFSALMNLLCEKIPDGDLELVLNGDIFDFDIPQVVAGHAVPSAAPRTELAAVKRLAQILDDHRPFVTTLARLLSRGHRVVLIAGNHDLQLNFSGVQALLRERIAQAARRLSNGTSPQFAAQRLQRRLEFHPWFYRTASGVHIEHGSQYDPYCSVADPEWPFHANGELHVNVGALALEHLVGKLGYFNPNVESSFLLTTREYIEHWRRYYLRTPRSLVGTFVSGALRVIWKLFRAHGMHGAQPRDPALQTAAEAAHSALFMRAELRAAMRLFAIDRLFIALALVVPIALCKIAWPVGICALLGVVGLHQMLKPRQAIELREVANHVEQSARRIARIYGASGVLFGHTHQPAGRWESDVFYGNSGTWVPMYRDVACSVPVEESRPFIWLREEPSGLQGGLYRFHDGALHPASDPRPPSSPSPSPSPSDDPPCPTSAREIARPLAAAA